MRREELDYELPPDRIAQRPAEPRDASRLLVLHRRTGRIRHAVFRDLPDLLERGDQLVLNDTRVIPARFFGRRRSGGRIEALFLQQDPDTTDWHVLLRPSARLSVGEELLVLDGEPPTRLVLVERGERGAWSVRPEPPIAPHVLLERCGHPPLPPYIRREPLPDEHDRSRYQTVYARSPGAVAAPTAGLHFTPDLFARLETAGVARHTVTLHVGLGTFAPITAPELAGHRMHGESYHASARVLAAIDVARRAGSPIVAVGTTSVRVLESLPALGVDEPPLGDAAGTTDIFIYPPYRFRNVDALLTNFHLPGSTLLALVMAFGGIERVRAAYTEAIRHGYRFYSYGDAMLIL